MARKKKPGNRASSRPDEIPVRKSEDEDKSRPTDAEPLKNAPDAPPTSLRLEDLVRGITPENRHSEFDTGKPLGREIW